MAAKQGQPKQVGKRPEKKGLTVLRSLYLGLCILSLEKELFYFVAAGVSHRPDEFYICAGGTSRL